MSGSASAARFLARRVSQALFAASPRHLLLIFSVLATERPARLGPAKVPKPSVDLIYMAAFESARSLARSVSTAECEVSFLPSSVLVWNGGGGVAIKEAWKEWNPAKEVLNLANVECRNG